MEWKNINSEYEVSDTGFVRSLDRPVRFTDRKGAEHFRMKRGKVLKPWLSGSGYCMVYLGRRSPRLVHVLVLQAFVGERPEGCEAAHLNNDKTDNRLASLAWKTRVENQSDRYLHGTRGVKLSQSDVQRIFDMHNSGMTQFEIARLCGVAQQTVWRILHGRALSGWAPNAPSPSECDFSRIASKLNETTYK